MIFAYTGAHLAQSQPPTTADILGNLPDALGCTVTRDTDGLFELALTYPAQGANAGALKVNNWIYSPVGGTMDMQYFRIDQTTEDIGGTVTVHASHVTYNSLAILAAPFSVHNSNDYSTASYYNWSTALTAAINSIDSTQMGSFSIGGYTDEMAVNPANYTEPVTLKQAILDAISGRPEIYLNYYDFGYRLWQLPPATGNFSFRIRYGRDMLSFSSSVDATDFYTHVMPYYIVDDKMVSHNQDVYPLEGLPSEYASLRRIKAINLADYYSSLNIELDLSTVESIIERWLAANPWNPLPEEISVENIPQEGNTFELGAVGRIYYTPTGAVYTANVVSLTYDVLAERVTSIGINKRQKDVTDTIAGLVQR